MNETKKITALAFLLSTAISFNLFWIMTILKAASPSLKKFLTFYAPIGPLSGLFDVSLVVLFVSFPFFSILFRIRKSYPEVREVVCFYFLSIILFFVMTFPLIFEPIADLLHPLFGTP